MKTIAITGASGFIGQHLLKHYLEEGAHVLAIVPDPEHLEDYKSYKEFEVVKAGFEDFNKISEMTDTHNIDIFYYLSWGGYGKATNDYSAQIENIKPICDAVNEASKMGCKRFLFSTSFSEYMISEHETLSHNAGAHCNVYGAAKQAARVMAHATAAQRNVPFLCVAFANTFGVGDRSHRSTNLFVHKLLRGEALDLTEGIHLYDWNYVEDTIAGLVLAGEKGIADSVYYIGSNERRPLKDIVSDVRDIICPGAEIRFGTYNEDFHVDYTSVDVTKLYRDTGYQPKWKFVDAVKATAEWVKTLDWE
ncbi:NAD(P)-dependent oxidoreductase [Bacteroides graminisolvens]|uniref:NAD-dependent epimerase/dehydratase family protein n=1 Tax=Bacteroides graminisolvens TaxID=477666 RepID=UPI0023F4B126|nr:NAD(P)-dependent oxidoreductase [Bacteroides graminisolvens]